MVSSFNAALRESKPLIGTLVTIACPEVAEVLALAGFDWLFVDLEHGSLSIQDAQRIVQAVAGRCFTLVRVPEPTAENIKRVLDTGCDGIIAPHVNSAEEARRIVALAKYPPAGKRSVGLARAHGYGLTFADYIATANDRIAIILQIEHRDAVAEVDNILALQGVDALFVGPYDLSASIGVMGQVADERVVQAIEKVRTACAKASVPFGIFYGAAEPAMAAIGSGARMVAVGTDLMHLANAAKSILGHLRLR